MKSIQFRTPLQQLLWLLWLIRSFRQGANPPAVIPRSAEPEMSPPEITGFCFRLKIFHKSGIHQLAGHIYKKLDFPDSFFKVSFIFVNSSLQQPTIDLSG